MEASQPQRHAVHGAVPELTLELLRTALDDPSITGWERAECDRAWENPGQALVERVQIATPAATSSTPEADARLAIIAKRARIPAMVKKSREKADDKLRSLAVEAVFLRECCPALNGAGAPAPTLLYHADPPLGPRTSLVLMTDLRATHPLSIAELDQTHAEVALDWLARMHATWLGKSLPAGQSSHSS